MEAVCVTECHGPMRELFLVKMNMYENFVYELDNSPAWEIPNVEKNY